MKRKRRYVEQSYESRLLFWLNQLHHFCADNDLRYALFGGAAVGAYIGHLPRKLHDLDVICDARDVRKIVCYLQDEGFQEQKTVKARKAGYWKFVYRNHIYEMIVSIFPMRFTLLDLDAVGYPVLGSYDFTSALARKRLLNVHSVDRHTTVAVYAIAFEDLIVSKLWPTFEPNTIHDLLLLLTSEAAGQFEFEYFCRCLEYSPTLLEFAAESLSRFEKSYPHTAWSRLALNQDRLTNRIQLLHDAIYDRTAKAYRKHTPTSHSSNGHAKNLALKQRCRSSPARLFQAH
jgi:hypothetical protein